MAQKPELERYNDFLQTEKSTAGKNARPSGLTGTAQQYNVLQ